MRGAVSIFRQVRPAEWGLIVLIAIASTYIWKISFSEVITQLEHFVKPSDGSITLRFYTFAFGAVLYFGICQMVFKLRTRLNAHQHLTGSVTGSWLTLQLVLLVQTVIFGSVVVAFSLIQSAAWSDILPRIPYVWAMIFMIGQLMAFSGIVMPYGSGVVIWFFLIFWVIKLYQPLNLPAYVMPFTDIPRVDIVSYIWIYMAVAYEIGYLALLWLGVYSLRWQATFFWGR